MPEIINKDYVLSIIKQIDHPLNSDLIQMIEAINVSKQIVKIMTHERGVGVTQACGSAACASVLIAREKEYVVDKVCVEMSGGKLNIEITSNDNVLMIGTAKKVYEGVIDIKNGK